MIVDAFNVEPLPHIMLPERNSLFAKIPNGNFSVN